MKSDHAVHRLKLSVLALSSVLGLSLFSLSSMSACRDSDRHGKGLDGALAGKKHPGPQFHGAGLSGAGAALSAGLVTISCEQPGPFPAGTVGPAPGAVATQECYFDASHPNDPAATMEWIVESAPQGELVHVRLTFNPNFVDNTYGAHAIGWEARTATPKPGTMPKPGKGGHTFKDLVGSDHAEFTLRDTRGATVLKFKADYLSESAAAPSGYESLGVVGGEGKMLTGDADAVVAVSTSLDRNLNTCGYESYTVDSPETDAVYTSNAATPHWDYRVVYDVWVKRSAFEVADFGRASVEFVHASPSKAGTNTIEVFPKPCPPNWPPYCSNPEGCDGEPECVGTPDAPCDTPTYDASVEKPDCVNSPDQYCEPVNYDAGQGTNYDAGQDAGVTGIVIP